MRWKFAKTQKFLQLLLEMDFFSDLYKVCQGWFYLYASNSNTLNLLLTRCGLFILVLIKNVLFVKFADKFYSSITCW